MRNGGRVLRLASHAAHSAEDPAGLDPHALGVDVPLDAAAGHDVQVAGGGDVAGDLAGDDHVAPANVAVHAAALPDDHRPRRLDGAGDGAVHPERALRLQVTGDLRGPT